MSKVKKNLKHKVTYYVNEEKKVVVAQVAECMHDATNEFDKRINNGNSMRIMLDLEDNRFQMMHRYTAIARCHEKDTFSIEKGKEIAFEKLANKYERALQHTKNRIIQYIVKQLDNL